GARRARDARARRRADPQARERDRLPAPLAHPVGPRVDPLVRGVDLLELGASAASQGVDLRALEGDRRALGVVLVVDVGARGRLDDVLEVALERREPLLGLAAPLRERAAQLLDLGAREHQLRARVDSGMTPSAYRLVATSWSAVSATRWVVGP